jgi:hypothetical protein
MSLSLQNSEGSAGLSLAIIPSPDLTQYYALCERNRAIVSDWCRALEIVLQAGKVTEGFSRAASFFRGQRGFSADRIRTKYYAWLDAGKDWRIFVNHAVEGNSLRKQPAEFIEFFRTLCENDQRTTSGAIVYIQSLWRDGKEIPGYGCWRQWYRVNHPGHPLPKFCPGYPAGWNERNLRRYAPTKYELKAVRIGRSAAATDRRLVYTTRAGLYVGAIYQFDDMWHDLMVNCLRERKPGRPLELFSHDLYSARKVRWGFRVRTKNDDGSYNGLAERMTRMILAATLYQDGYSPRGTKLVAEHGTAAISDRIEQSLLSASGGLITVHRSGMEGAPTHDGLYAGRAKGNFHFKASLESLNNLTHNRFAHLPGQTGKDVMNRPEQLHGLLKNNDALLAAMSQLPPDRAALLQFPLLTTEEFFRLALAIYENIHNRTEHDLEGWQENIVPQFQLGGIWQDRDALMLLPPAEQSMAMAMLQSGAITTRERRLSPNEVWQRGASDLIPIHAGAVCDILGPDLAAERTIRSQMIEFQDIEVSRDPLRYSALVRDIHGRETLIRDGEKVLAFANPFDTEQLFLQDARGKFLGIAPRVQSVCSNDLEAIHRACGAAAKVESAALAPIRARHAQEARDKSARHRHNAALLDATIPATPAEKQRDRETKSRIRDLDDDILDTLTSSQQAAEEDDDTDEVCDAIDALL